MVKIKHKAKQAVSLVQNAVSFGYKSKLEDLKADLERLHEIAQDSGYEVLGTTHPTIYIEHVLNSYKNSLRISEELIIRQVKKIEELEAKTEKLLDKRNKLNEFAKDLLNNSSQYSIDDIVMELEFFGSEEESRPYKDPDGNRHWRLHGKLHRENGPALIKPDGSEEWWLDAKLHRKDGPAIRILVERREGLQRRSNG